MENQDNSGEKDEALDMMEYTEEPSHKKWDCMDDAPTREDCRALMDARYELLRREAEKRIDVEAELEEAKARWRRKRMRLRRKWLGGAVAALLAGLLFVVANQPQSGKPQTRGVTVFVADTRPQPHIILQEEGGRKLLLDREEAGTPQPPHTAPRTLDYTQPTAQAPQKVERQHVQTHSITIPWGETFKLVLADGTQVWLNADSKLSYPTAFTGNQRKVFLEGEAYFKVAKGKEPFVVETAYLTTKVLGTEFNVNSYTRESSHVTLVNGRVQVCSIHSPQDQCVELEPGKDALLRSDGSFEVNEANVAAYTYWRDGYFYFDNQTLEDIMKSIGRWYNVNIVFRNPEAMHYRMHFMSNRQRGIDETILLMNCLKKVTLTLSDNTLFVD